MSDYKDLHIDRSKITIWIEEYIVESSGTVPDRIEQTQINEKQFRFNIYINDSKYTIDFYFNKTGTTSINTSVGNEKNRKYIAPIADYIKSKHKSYVGVGKSMSVSLKEDDFQTLIDLIKTDHGINWKQQFAKN